MSVQNVKEEARRLVENLPEDVTWEDLMYQIYVRQTIEAGLADSETDRVIELKDVRKRFGLPERESSGPRPLIALSKPSMTTSLKPPSITRGE